MDRVLYIVQRSNQRGGRMLSVIDLLDAGTMNRPQLCWLLARIESGASWMVGARPGGAGKTTIMSALLAMLPEGESVRLTSHGEDWRTSRPNTCLVSYEISPGSYEAYIWGRDVARLAELALAGCRVVTNLHADTLAEARAQIVEQNGASEEGFNALETFVPLCVQGRHFDVRRVVRDIWYCDDDNWRLLDLAAHKPSERERLIGAFLDRCQREKLLSVQAVRAAWLQWLRDNPRS